MPYLYDISPRPGISAGVWKISETAEELLDSIQLSHSEKKLYGTFRNELRKKQWLACRALLKQLLSPLPAAIQYDPNGKPRLLSGSHHISVSHAGDFAAAVCSEKHSVGIDIEIIKERIERVKERFLQQRELDSITADNRLEQLYVYWGGKEALYKLHGSPDLDLRNDIYIQPFDYLCNMDQSCKALLRIQGSDVRHWIFYRKMEDQMLVVAF